MRSEKVISYFSLCHFKVCGNIAANEQGLAMWWNLNYVCTQLKPNDCNIADVLFISQIYNVKLELKLIANYSRS